MPSITLKSGDFGSDVTVTFDSSTIYLPDPARPGGIMPMAIAAIKSVETLSEDHTGRVKAAVKLGAAGALAVGPVGLAAGLLAMRKPLELTIRVTLVDGRAFTAVSDAVTVEELRTARLGPPLAGAGDADSVIEKYLLALADDVRSAEVTLPPRHTPPASAPAADPPVRPARPERPVFGRRGR